MRKRLWRGLIGVAIAVACLLLLWVGGTDRRRLLDRSTWVTSVRSWGMRKPDVDMTAPMYNLIPDVAQYQWVGNGHILFFHDLPVRISTDGSSRFSMSFAGLAGTPTLYDLAAHRELPLPKLAELFRSSRGQLRTAAVSPDSSSLLWQDGQEHVHSAKLDGSQHVSVENNGDSYAGWETDSRRFYTYDWRSVEQRKAVSAFRVWDIQNGISLERREFATPAEYGFPDNLMLASNGSLIANTFRSQGSQLNILPQSSNMELKLYVINPAPNSVAHTVSPTLPDGSTVQALVYSPRGDKLAWVINRTVPAPFAFLHRWLPSYKATPQKTTALWVSGTLGENLREIGHISISEHGRHFYLIDYVRWQPDGKTLSFVSNDTLYTVPAD